MAALHTSFENLEKICAKNPTSILFARLAEGVLQKGDVVRATEICRQGLRYRPSYVAGHVVMGKCHLSAGRIEEARQEFQKVLQLDADHPAALWNLGQIDLDLGWEDLALGHFERALVLDPLDEKLKAKVAALRAKRPDAPLPVAEDIEADVADGLETPPPGDAAVREEAVDEPVLDAAFEFEAPHAAEDAEPPLDWDGDIAPAAPPARETEDESPDLPVDSDDGAPRVDAAPIATLTLAELYVGQGLIAQAVGVLEHMMARDPDNRKVRDRLAELRSGGASD